MFKRLYRFLGTKFFPIFYAQTLGVTFGKNCRFINVSFGSEPYLISLGDHVSATNVSFVTHDGGVWVFRGDQPQLDVIAPISVGNNVFLGLGTVVLPGVHIGDNVVVGAGSVVTNDIPSDCVAAGVPARVVCSLADYRKKISTEAINTKNLAKHVKKNHLLNLHKK